MRRDKNRLAKVARPTASEVPPLRWRLYPAALEEPSLYWRLFRKAGKYTLPRDKGLRLQDRQTARGERLSTRVTRVPFAAGWKWA